MQKKSLSPNLVQSTGGQASNLRQFKRKINRNQFNTLPVSEAQSQDNGDIENDILAASGRYKPGRQILTMKKKFAN